MDQNKDVIYMRGVAKGYKEELLPLLLVQVLMWDMFQSASSYREYIAICKSILFPYHILLSFCHCNILF